MRKFLSKLRALVVRACAVLFLFFIFTGAGFGIAAATARVVSIFSGFDVTLLDGLAVAVGIYALFWLPIFELARRIQGRDPPRLLKD